MPTATEQEFIDKMTAEGWGEDLIKEFPFAILKVLDAPIQFSTPTLF